MRGNELTLAGRQFLPPQCTALTSPILSHFPESALFPHPAALPTSSCTLTCTPILSRPSPIHLLQHLFHSSFPSWLPNPSDVCVSFPASHHPRPPNPLYSWHTPSLWIRAVKPNMGWRVSLTEDPLYTPPLSKFLSQPNHLPSFTNVYWES